MHCLATIRIALAGAALAFTLAAQADTSLDALIEDHVMPRFDRQARAFVNNAGARFVSSRWNSETRTLIAFGELDRRLSAAPVDVAHQGGANMAGVDLKNAHVTELCRHPDVALITRFLAKYEVTIALVYDRSAQRLGPAVIEIAHTDLGGCR